jgi:hypothetical protein
MQYECIKTVHAVLNIRTAINRTVWAQQVTIKVVLKLFPDYASIQDEVHVRITDLPIQDKLRDLREVSI